MSRKRVGLTVSGAVYKKGLEFGRSTPVGFVARWNVGDDIGRMHFLFFRVKVPAKRGFTDFCFGAPLPRRCQRFSFLASLDFHCGVLLFICETCSAVVGVAGVGPPVACRLAVRQRWRITTKRFAGAHVVVSTVATRLHTSTAT